jgi:hypothetical protein
MNYNLICIFICTPICTKKFILVKSECYSNVCNHAHPEGSMIEGYTTEKVIECCVDYIKDGKPIGVPVL